MQSANMLREYRLPQFQEIACFSYRLLPPRGYKYRIWHFGFPIGIERRLQSVRIVIPNGSRGTTADLLDVDMEAGSQEPEARMARA